MARPDPRFFESLTPLTASELATRVGADWVRGEDRRLSAVAPLAEAGSDDIAFLGDRRFQAALSSTRAGAVIVPEAAAEFAPPEAAVLVSPEPQAAWARASHRLHRLRTLDSLAERRDVVEDDTVVIEPGAVIGEGVRIGARTRIGANAVIGPGVQIGRDCRIGSNTSLTCALIGDQVTILAGARLGEAGFGAAASRSGPVDVPQLGRVIVQDRVTIGANTCIDRGAFADTVIGENTKIDNLVMIGHNCVIGRGNLMAGHVGIAGSVTTGDHVMFGGRAGVGDHIHIGEGARVAAGGGVLADVPAGETWSGYPAKPLRQSLREAVWLAKQAGGRTRGKAE